MKFETIEIKSIGHLIDSLKSQKDSDAPIWYRGQGNSSWKLEPKLMRIDPLPSESHYLNKFKQNATFILQNKPATEFEWLFLMQHYGVATRLLDWSESPLVSLYFALSDETQAEEDAALWVLSPTELNKRNRYRPDFDFEIPSFEDDDLNNYLPSVIAAERKTSLFPMAAIAARNSSRIQAQQGVFTISHRENIFVDEAGEDPKNHIWKYIIPAARKNDLLKELEIIGITKFQLFPELSSIAQNIK
jgi:hypothetical protein